MRRFMFIAFSVFVSSCSNKYPALLIEDLVATRTADDRIAVTGVVLCDGDPGDSCETEGRLCLLGVWKQDAAFRLEPLGRGCATRVIKGGEREELAFISPNPVPRDAAKLHVTIVTGEGPYSDLYFSNTGNEPPSP